MSTTYGTTSAITIPSDGDTIDAADVNTFACALWDQHDFLDTLVALQAILVPTHGLTRYVRGYGHYTFVTSGTYSATTAQSPWILAATDGTAGRWAHQDAAMAIATIGRRVNLSRSIIGVTAITAKNGLQAGPDWMQENPGHGEAIWAMKLARARAQLAGDPSGGAS